jgi:hypothetical protein
MLLVEVQPAMIGDGHAMGVAAEITQPLHGTTEGWLGIDDPVVSVQAAEEFGKLLRIGESGCRTGAAKLVATVKTRRWSSSSIILRKRVTGISFPYDPHYVSRARNLSAHPRGSVRRASGLVLVSKPYLTGLWTSSLLSAYRLSSWDFPFSPP